VLDAVTQRLAAAAPQVAIGTQVPAVQKKIRILTMHGAKGLSGKVVFIPSAEQGIMPSQRALAATGLLIDARRLFYVSLTRAVVTCIVSHAATHTGPAAFQLMQRPLARMTRSQFLNEMGVVSINRVSGLTAAEVAQIVTDIANL
jgi:superfamily I DNA/RNA helicase